MVVTVSWLPHAKSWLIGKDSDARRGWGKDSDARRGWGQKEKGTTEDEMAGWHHRLDVREFEWTPEDGDGQGGLACCDSWGCKESDTTQRLNWTELNSLLPLSTSYSQAEFPVTSTPLMYAAIEGKLRIHLFLYFILLSVHFSSLKEK